MLSTQADAQEYLEGVEPIIGESVRGVSEVVRPEAREGEDGELELGVEVAPVEEAREAARRGVGRLRGVEAPEDLRPVHDQLLDSYEKALPAYDNIIEAFDSGNPARLGEAVRENLPVIEQLGDVERGILQDLQEATPDRTESRG